MKYAEYAQASMTVGAVDSFKFWLDSEHKISRLSEQDTSFLTDTLASLRPGLEALKEVAK